MSSKSEFLLEIPIDLLEMDMRMKYLIKVIALGALFVLTNNCSGTNSGFGTVSGYCNGTGCTANSSLSSNAAVYISQPSLTIPKSYSILGCGSSCPTGVYACTAGVCVGGIVYTQQLQVTGICNPPVGATTATVTYSVSRSGVALPTDIYGVSYASKTFICDNGQFTLILTPPSDSTQINSPASVLGATFFTPYQLTVSLNTGSPAATVSQTQVNFSVSY
jgi:hypothetical protein